MATGSNDVDDIYRRMALIRRETHANVSESVAGAEAVVDWGRYTWTYPWMALGAAAVAGYLVYTGSRREIVADTANPLDEATVKERAEGVGIKSEERSRTIQNLLLAAGGVVLPVAINAAQNYVLHWLQQQYPTKSAGQDQNDRSNHVGR